MYLVHYGNNTSVERLPTWKEAARAIKQFLDSGVRIRAVEKVNHA